MDAEHESLRVEAESLRVQAKRAREARKDAEAREAAEAMPETHKRLRAKLENPGCPELIITEPRTGYRLSG